jgi:hypothetical protein
MVYNISLVSIIVVNVFERPKINVFEPQMLRSVKVHPHHPLISLPFPCLQIDPFWTNSGRFVSLSLLRLNIGTLSDIAQSNE